MILPNVRSDAAAPGRLFLAMTYGACVAGISALSSQASAWLLALVTLGSFAAFGGLWRVLFQGRLSYVDPGLFFLFVVTLYTVIPLLTFEYYDFNLARSGDNRLATITLDRDLIYSVWLCANLVMGSFGAAYLAIRQPHMPRLIVPRGPVGALWTGFIGAFGVMFVTFLYRQVGDSYADEYLFFRTLPTIVLQLFNIISALFFICAWGLFAHFLTNGRRLQATLLLLMSLLFFLIVTEARAGLVLIAGGFLVAWDHFAKRFSTFALFSTATAGLAIFLLLGFLREQGAFGVEDAAGRSEFMAVFVTALDVQQLYLIGSTLDMNVSMLMSDLLRLVPQQLLPFEKVDPATWYVSTFYPHYAEAGGGLAFGMISESVLGGGASAAVLRGFLLGAIVSLAFNFLSRGTSIWRTILYIWLFVSLYQCFRDTTFTLGGRLIFQVAPALIIVMFMTQFLKPRFAPLRPAHRDGLPPLQTKPEGTGLS